MPSYRVADLDPKFAAEPLAGAGVAVYTSLNEC
jgi:hypothetical protein